MECVSIIVPVFNAEKYLEECISSIICQTYQDFELILINDGSTDKSALICDKYANIDSRIRVIHKENGGVSSARNAGIISSKGKYLVFVDADDILSKDFLKEGMSIITDNSIDIFISGIRMNYYQENVVIKNEDLGVVRDTRYHINELLEQIDIDFPLMCICGPWAKIYRKKIIDNNNIRFDESLSFGEDTRFNLNVYKHCSRAFFSEKKLYYYRRINGESLFSKFKVDTYELHRDEYSMLYYLMKEKNCNQVAFNRFNNLYFSMMIGCICEYYRNYSNTSFSDRLGLIRKISEDEFVRSIHIKNNLRIKDKMILFLLRTKQSLSVMILFYIRIVLVANVGSRRRLNG